MNDESWRFLPSLPLLDAPAHAESEDYTIRFRTHRFGQVTALVVNEFEDMVDEIPGRNFMDAYDRVRDEYPQAQWRNPEDVQSTDLGRDTRDVPS